MKKTSHREFVNGLQEQFISNNVVHQTNLSKNQNHSSDEDISRADIIKAFDELFGDLDDN